MRLVPQNGETRNPAPLREHASVLLPWRLVPRRNGIMMTPRAEKKGKKRKGRSKSVGTVEENVPIVKDIWSRDYTCTLWACFSGSALGFSIYGATERSPPHLFSFFLFFLPWPLSRHPCWDLMAFPGSSFNSRCSCLVGWCWLASSLAGSDHCLTVTLRMGEGLLSEGGCAF